MIKRPLIFMLLVMFGMFVMASANSDAATHKMTREEARKLLAKAGEPETPDGMLSILQTSLEDGPQLVEAYLAIGVPADQPIPFKTDDGQTLSAYPLNYLLRFDCRGDTTLRSAKILLDAGADPSRKDEGDNGRTPAIATVGCPDVLREILAKKPDLTLTDKFKNTAMDLAIQIGEPRVQVVQMLLDAGFDIRPSKKKLLEEARGEPEIIALLEGRKSPASAAPQSTGSIDWKSLPPYPQRSKADAQRMLSRPGAATTVQDHFWDGITSREPFRLALALQGGADVRATRSVTGFTPLVLAAERCDLDREPAQQAAVTEQLIAAGADLTGVDTNRANALTTAAHGCPIGVVAALIKAGLPLTAVSSTGDTPLRSAILAGRADVVALLLNAGVDPKKEPYNARKMASGNEEIEKLLKGKR